MSTSPFDENPDPNAADSALDMDFGGDSDSPMDSLMDESAAATESPASAGPTFSDTPASTPEKEVQEIPEKRTPMTVYAMLLAGAFACLCIGCILLYMELREYGQYPYWKTTEVRSAPTTGP